MGKISTAKGRPGFNGRTLQTGPNTDNDGNQRHQKRQQSRNHKQEHQEATKNITMSMLTYTRLLTIPPQYEDDENREIIPLNRLIRLDSRRPLNIKALDNMEKSMILERDGYHLSWLAGQRIAEELMGQAISPTEHKKEDRRKIEISPHDAPHIIGRKGKRVQELRQTYGI